MKNSFVFLLLLVLSCSSEYDYKKPSGVETIIVNYRPHPPIDVSNSSIRYSFSRQYNLDSVVKILLVSQIDSIDITYGCIKSSYHSRQVKG